MNWFVLISGITSNSLAAILIKVAVMSPKNMHSLEEFLQALRGWPLFFGIGFYCVGLLCYTIALTRLPLNVVHPVMTAGTISLVALLSRLIFSETFHLTTVSGIILVILGVILINA